MDLIILIDCLEDDIPKNWLEKSMLSMFGRFSRSQTCWRNIKNFVNDNKNISAVILSSYNCVDAEYKSNNHWYTKNRDWLGIVEFNNKIPRLFDSDDKSRTSQVLLDWKCDRFQIAMHFPWELEKLLCSDSIENIYFCGTAWDKCVRDRPLGYLSVYDLVQKLGLKINFFIKRDCVLDSNANYFIPELNPDWEETENKGIYKFVPE